MRALIFLWITALQLALLERAKNGKKAYYDYHDATAALFLSILLHTLAHRLFQHARSMFLEYVCPVHTELLLIVVLPWFEKTVRGYFRVWMRTGAAI